MGGNLMTGGWMPSFCCVYNPPGEGRSNSPTGTATMDYAYRLMRSSEDEEKFFAKLGRFFASPAVRRECGGYPLNDGPDYVWLVAQEKRRFRVAGFISLQEHAGEITLREGYVTPEHRGDGLFRELLRKAMHYIDEQHLPASANVRVESVPHLEKLGFRVARERGAWRLMHRDAQE